MSKAKDTSDGPATHLPPDPLPSPDSPPRITSPSNGAVVGVRPVITGICHPRRNVRVVSPNQENYLSAETQPTNGHFQLSFLQDLKPGRTDYQILQWKMYPDSHKRSAVQQMYYLPAPTVTSPTAGARVGTKPTVTGTGGIPGAGIQVVRHGNPAVTYATATVAANGSWSAPFTIALPVGQFMFTARYQLDGKNGTWLNSVTVNVTA